MNTPHQGPARVAPSSRDVPRRIAYQGEPGANSHLACQEVYRELEPLACPTFEDAIAAVKSGDACYAMIPIENSLAGRVADIHHLLPSSGLYIVGEHFLPIRFQLMGLKGAKLSQITDVYSHIHALGQCRKVIREHGFRAHVAGDTAGAARQVADWKDPTRAALAPRLAAEIYGLDILAEDVEDERHNTTRFVILSAEPDQVEPDGGLTVTTFIFNVRNVPAALYKALGGFATNGINMTKLESYQVNGEFVATMFYADIEGHPDERPVQLALEELSFFSTELRILGSYRASPYRAEIARKARARKG
ncbi:MAG TPA: prephenate dehydratase [Hyphomicrobiaceae bacterium]|nr:prephenate dehydratase [Hyphomicrobiaceae bacterium]